MDELKIYMDLQYIGPIELCQHILEFPRYLEFSAVYCLPIHLKDDQTIYFDSKDNIQDVANYLTSTKTQLIEQFTGN